MARGPLQGRGVSALPALLLLLLGPPATPDLTCPTPKSVEHADIQVKSYSLNSRERYICNSGFKRKAGTSSLTECVFNKTMNVAHWTTPNLKCIRDPSLSLQSSPSTIAPAGVTPEPESPSPSGQEPAFTSKSDTTVATKPATIPSSKLMPSKPTSAGTTEVVSNERTQTPPQTTKVMEHTTSTSPKMPGAQPHSATTIQVVSFIPAIIICGAFLSLAWYIKSRLTFQTGAEMQNTEDTSMTREMNTGEEDTESQHRDQERSMENQRPAEMSTLL